MKRKKTYEKPYLSQQVIKMGIFAHTGDEGLLSGLLTCGSCAPEYQTNDCCGSTPFCSDYWGDNTCYPI